MKEEVVEENCLQASGFLQRLQYGRMEKTIAAETDEDTRKAYNEMRFHAKR